MQGTIQVMQAVERARDAQEAKQRFIRRMERREEHEAIRWYGRAQSDQERDKVKRLYSEAFHRLNHRPLQTN